jgi:polysaccharide biosynthesis transport protein
MGAAVIAALIAYFSTQNEQKQYKSIAQISTGFTISDEIKVNSDNFNFYEADTKFENAVVTITSPTVLTLLSYTLILHDLQNPRPFRQLTNEEKNSDLYRSINKQNAITLFEAKHETMSLLTSYDADEKKLIELLKLYGYDYNSLSKSLNAYRLERTDYIEINYQSENPELSAFVVNTTYQEFIRYYTNMRSEKSEVSIDTLRSILEKKKQILDEKNQVLQSNGLLNGDLEAKSDYELIKDLQTKIADKKDNLTTLNFSLQEVNRELGIAPAASETAAIPDNTNQELVDLRNRMNAASDAYTQSGNTDKASLDLYHQLQKQYQHKVLTLSANSTNAVIPQSSTNGRNALLEKKGDIEVQIESDNSNIVSLQSQIDNLQGNVITEASKNASTQTLSKDAEQANKDYLDAKTAYNNAMDINYSSVNNFRQILMGQPAMDPEPSKRLLIVAMAGMSALVITILVIILVTYFDSSVRTPSIFSKAVNLKLLSIVTNLDKLDPNQLADVLTKPNYTTTGSNQNKADKNRQNIFRESLRKLRYEIESSGKKIFLFTSTKKGEGKTTLIQALSYIMSLNKKKILIIDTNFCNNDLTTQLHVEAMLEKINPDNVDAGLLKDIKSMVTNVGSGTVYVIGCESGDYTPSEALPRKNLLQRLQTLTSEYDFIFLEGPPLNDFADSKELAQYVDGVIAVFSASRNIKQMDKESIKFFKDLKDKFYGSVLNKVKLENMDAG